MKVLANIITAVALLLGCLVAGTQIYKAYQENPVNARTYVVEYVVCEAATKRSFAHSRERVTITECPMSSQKRKNLRTGLVREIRAGMKEQYGEDYLQFVDIAIIDFIELIPADTTIQSGQSTLF